jgi:hypothetical protein
MHARGSQKYVNLHTFATSAGFTWPARSGRPMKRSLIGS